MRQFYLLARNPVREFEILQYIDGAETVQIDASAWAEENGALTTATWSTEYGDAAVSGAALASSVASAVITTPNRGRSMVRAKLENGTEVINVWINVGVKDPSVIEAPLDYVEGYR